MTRKKFLDYAGLQNFLNRIKGLIPTKTSELQNDSGYITAQGTYDDELSLVSEQAVQNKVVTAAINSKQATLSSGQLDAANSGVTAAKVQGYDSHLSNTDIHVTQTDKTNWDSKAAGTHTHIASDVSGLSTVATSGSYNDLSNKPNIPSKTSDLTNDSGFLTSHNPVDSALSSTSTNAVQNKVIKAELDNKANSADLSTVAATGNYTDLNNIPSNFTPASHTHGSITNDGKLGTASRALITDGNKKIAVSSVTSTELGYLSGVTSAVQDQLDGKAASTHSHTASEVSGLATVATSGSYNDLTNKPTIPTVNNATLTIQKNGTTVKTFTANASANVTANITVPTKVSELTNDSGFLTSHNPVDSALSDTSTNAVQNKVVKAELDGKSDTGHTHTKSEITDFPTLATVATSGSYNDLTNKPTIPTVNNATLTIQKNGTTVKTFTANASSNVTANITVPTKVSELTNDSGFLTSASNLDSSKLTGTIDIARLPKGALERLVTVADQTARFALTTSDVQLGDTVKQLDTGVMYIVSDESKLSSADGYTEYTAGAATSVPWSGVTGKPSSYTPASHSHGNIANGGTLGTASRALITDGNKKITTSSVTSTELGYVSGVTSAIQTQLDGKAPSSHTHTASDVSGLATVATSGSYNDLSNKPTIPTVNNATLTIQKNGTTVKTFTANASSNVTANITVPTKTSDLTNDSHQTITVGTDTTSTASPAHSGTFTCIDSVTRDSNGHVTAVNTKTVTLPADNNTDTLVTQNVSTANENHPVLLTVTKDATANQGAKTSIFASGVKVNPSTNTVTATTFSGALSGNASTATQFSANKSVTLTGDVTGTASSKAGWSVATTLADSGVTAGTYGPSADVTGNNNATISVPEITVDSKGRVTSVANRTLTCKNNTYNVYNKTLTIQKNGTNVATFTSNSNTDVTANITVPTKVSELTNDSGYLTSHQSLANYVTLNSNQTITEHKTFTKNADPSSVSGIEDYALSFQSLGNCIYFNTRGSSNITSYGTVLWAGYLNSTAPERFGRLRLYRTSDKRGETNDGYIPDPNEVLLDISPHYKFIRFTGNVEISASGTSGTDNYIKPITTNVTTLGTSSNIWKNVYANAYYLGTTAFGDIVTHNANEFLTSHQSLSNYSTLANTVKSISISGKTITVTPGSGSAYTLTTQDTVYTHPTTSGNKHIPSGGSSGQFLGWDSDGTAKWVNNPNTNTDTLMTQNVSTTNATYPILLCATADATANQGAKTGIFAKSVKVNPSTNVISASGFSGPLTGNVTGNCSGSSGSCTGLAAKATGDVDGNAIKTTYAKLASPALTGIPTAPTAAIGTNSTQIATTEFVYNNAAKHFYAATNIYVAKAATGNGSGSNTSNYMSLADLRTFLATVHMHSSASDLNGAYNLQLLFKAGDSFGNETFDAAKMPGVRNLILNTSTGTNSTVDNYSTNSPTFGNIVVTGDISVTMRNLNCTGRISSQYGAYVAIDTYMGISSLQAVNYGYLNVAKNMVINVCDAHTDYLFSATNNGILAMWPGATVTINFRQQCYYTRCLFMSASNGTAWIGYSSFKLTGTEPMAVWGGSGTLTGTSETAAATAEKAVTLASGQTFTLTKNATAKVKFTIDNTAANPTLNIGGTGAKPIYWNNAAVPAAMLMKNITYDVKYNGSQFVIQNAVKRLTNNDFGVFRSTGNYDQTYNSGSWNFTGWALYYGTGIENSNWRGSHIGNIQQNVTSNNNTFPILFSGTANATANTSTAPYFGTGIKVNPSTSIISASGFSGLPPATTYVAAVADGGALVNSQTTSFGAVWRAPTKNYQVAGATFPNNNDTVYICYSVTNANVTAGTNTVAKQLTWAADTGTLTANAFSGALTGNVTGNCSGSSGSCTGNAATATQFSANKSVTLTGDVTGTASSKAGWSVATTLANSGVTAGTYGPSADVTGNNNATISVPQITVDAKGRVTSVTNRTLTCKNNTYTVNNATLTIQKNGTNVQTFTANQSSNATANITVPTKVSELTNDSGYLTEHQDLSLYPYKVSAYSSYGNGRWPYRDLGDTTTYPNGFNEIVTTGKYQVRFTGSTPNSPYTVTSTANDGILEIEGISSAGSVSSYQRVVQRFYKYNSAHIVYFRAASYHDGQWNWSSSWTVYGDIVTHDASEFLTSHQSLSNYSTLANTVKSLSISGKTITVTPGSGSAYTLTTQDTVYTHPTTSGNKHIPSGGSSGQFLGWDSDGTAKWVNNPNSDTKNTAGSTDTSSKIFLIGATSQAANPQTYSHDTAYVGTDGCLYSGGTKVLTAHQSLSNYSTLANTVKSLSISGKTITVTPGSGSAYTLTTQDTVYTHPTTAGNKHIPSGGSSGQFLGWDSDGTAKWVNNPNSDTLMTQNVSTTNSTYPVLLCPTADATSNQGAKTGIFAKSVKINPKTNTLYTSNLIYSGSLYQYKSDYTKGEAFTSNVYLGMAFKDSVGTSLADILYFQNTVANDGKAAIGFRVFGNANYSGTNTPASATFGCGVTKDNEVFTFAPTPATSDNSTQIATTAFVNAQGYSKTDTKVSQTVTTTDSEYPILAMTTASATATETNGARFSKGARVGTRYGILISQNTYNSDCYLGSTTGERSAGGMYGRDYNNENLFKMQGIKYTSGRTAVRFDVYNKIASGAYDTAATATNAYWRFNYDITGKYIDTDMACGSNWSPLTTNSKTLGTSSLLWKALYATTVYEGGTALSSKYALNENFGKGTTTWLYINATDFPTGSGSSASIQYNNTVDGTKLYVWYSVCNADSILDIHPTATKVSTTTGQVWRYLGVTVTAAGLGHSGASPTGILGLFRRES